MRVGQQECLARALETLAVDVCCIQLTRIHGSSSVIRLTSQSSPSVKFCLRLSGDSEAPASGVVAIGVALIERAEAELLDWIPVYS